jgi:hypothetical protein
MEKEQYHGEAFKMRTPSNQNLKTPAPLRPAVLPLLFRSSPFSHFGRWSARLPKKSPLESRRVFLAFALSLLLGSSIALGNGVGWYAEDYGVFLTQEDAAFIDSRAFLYTENSYQEVGDAEINGGLVGKLHYLNLIGQPYYFDLEFFDAITRHEDAFYHSTDPASAVAYNTANGTNIHWRFDNRLVGYADLGDFSNSIHSYEIFRNGQFIARVDVDQFTEDGLFYQDTGADINQTNVYRIKSLIDNETYDFSFDVEVPSGIPETPTFWLLEADFVEKDHRLSGLYTLEFLFGYQGAIQTSPMPFQVELPDFKENPYNWRPLFQVSSIESQIDTDAQTIWFRIVVDTGYNKIYRIGGFVFRLNYTPAEGAIQFLPIQGKQYYRTNLNNRVAAEGNQVYLMDPSDPNYRQEFINAADRYITQRGYGGIFCDNFFPSIARRINTFEPCDYNRSQYSNGMVDFASEVREALDGYAEAGLLVVNGVTPWFLNRCGRAGIHLDGIMQDGWSALRNWNRALLNCLWTARNFPNTHFIVRGIVEHHHGINRIQNLISLLLIKNNPLYGEPAETLLGARGYGKLAYFAEQQLTMGNQIGNPFENQNWSSVSWRDLNSGDLDRLWPDGLPGFYNPPFVYRVYENGCLLVDASLGPFTVKDIIPSEVIEGLPEDLYQVHVDQYLLREGGRVWTTPQASSETFTLQDGLVLFMFDPISSPTVGETALDPLYSQAGTLSVISVTASHWDGNPLSVEVDASGVGGSDTMGLNDAGEGGDQVAGDGIYSSEEFQVSASEGIYSLPLTAVGQDGVALFDEIEVEVTANGGTPEKRLGAVGSSEPDVNAFPNPSNPTTEISFLLKEAARVKLTIFNLQGKEVRLLLAEPLPAGPHAVLWKGTDNLGRPVPSGAYFYRLEAGRFSKTKRLLVVK